MWDLGLEDVYTHTHSGHPLACAAALVVLHEVPRLLPRVAELSERFEAAGWRGCGLLRVRSGDPARAEQNGVLVIPIPAAEGRSALIQAAPPFTISDAELEEAFARLG
jgi:adenosylmethionine-8-amino-7-oxononanoate aminotransferase